MADLTPHQQKIVKRYYDNIDAIGLQRLAELVSDLDVELFDSGGQVVRRIEVRDNHQSLLRLAADGREVSRIRVTCLATRGHDRAEIFEVRAYE